MLQKKLLVGLCLSLCAVSGLQGRSATVVFGLDRGPARSLMKKAKNDIIKVTVKDAAGKEAANIDLKFGEDKSIALDGEGFTVMARNQRTGATSESYKINLPALRRMRIVVKDKGLRERITLMTTVGGGSLEKGK